MALCAKEKLTVRELLKFAGLVISMSVAIGVKAYIWMKPLFHDVCRSAHRKHEWDVKRKISSEARNCLNYWVKELQMLSYQTPIDKDKSAVIVLRCLQNWRSSICPWGEIQTSTVADGAGPDRGERAISLVK